MDAHEAETKPLREMKDERTQKTIAKIIWILKEQCESDAETTVKGSIVDVLTGLKHIFDNITESCAATLNCPLETMRKEVLAMLEEKEKEEAT